MRQVSYQRPLCLVVHVQGLGDGLSYDKLVGGVILTRFISDKVST